MNARPDVILIRHGEVESHCRSLCYGELDVPLSERGYAESLKRAKEIAGWIRPSAIFHSGLMRTQLLADAVAGYMGDNTPTMEDRRLRERHYGQWQGMRWDEVYQADPEFHNLIHQPDTYRPPGGETTSEMQSRVVEWLLDVYDQFAAESRQTIVAISHSGPIAALSGHLLALPAECWQDWMLKPLEGIHVLHSSDAHSNLFAQLRPILSPSAFVA